jgi:GTP-binding protein HflX
VALVGYTNAGKSTLFNRLTGADVLAKDMLFATLDPTMRAMTLPGGRKVILSDTVGFITDLPTGLIAAFRATLEEVIGADLILHVRDVSHADTEMQAASVHEVLRELGLGDAVERGLFEVWNKIDRLDEDARARLTEQAARSDQIRVPVSALTGYGCEALLARVEGQLSQGEGVVEFDLPLSDGAGLAWLYRTGEVLERKEGENSVTLKVRLTPTDRARFAARRGQPATRH